MPYVGAGVPVTTRDTAGGVTPTSPWRTDYNPVAEAEAITSQVVFVAEPVLDVLVAAIPASANATGPVAGRQVTDSDTAPPAHATASAVGPAVALVVAATTAGAAASSPSAVVQLGETETAPAAQAVAAAPSPTIRLSFMSSSAQALALASAALGLQGDAVPGRATAAGVTPTFTVKGNSSPASASASVPQVAGALRVNVTPAGAQASGQVPAVAKARIVLALTASASADAAEAHTPYLLVPPHSLAISEIQQIIEEQRGAISVR